MSSRTRRIQRNPSQFSQASTSIINLNGFDKFSQLHESILQHILFFLPLEDAIAMSSVSKAWLHAWKSLPVFEYHFNHNRDDTLEELVSTIDDALSTLNKRRAIVKSFFLHIDLPPQEGNLNLVSDRFHDWMSLIVKNNVKEIEIRVSNNSNAFHTLPEALFTSRSLVKLQLEGCSFPSSISSHTTNSLKELSLLNVVATEEQVQKLVDLSKPSLEKLIIKMCPSVEVFILNDFPMLSYVEIQVKVFHIQSAPNLQTLILYALWRIDCFNCPNITTLSCYNWELFNAYKSIQELIMNLPLLETLHLFLSHTEKVKVQSRHLKTLVLCESERNEVGLEVEIDTPSLRTLSFSGVCIPFVSVVNERFENVDEELKLHHYGHPSGGIDGRYLHLLGMYSQNFLHPCVGIYLHKIFTENLLSLEELKVECPIVFYAPNVSTLVIDHIPASSDYTSFLDCLFWSCHPSVLKVMITTEESLFSPYSEIFVQFLCKELLHREHNYPLTCCTPTESALSKCWKHFLADVKCYVYKNIYESDPIDLPTQMAQSRITLINDQSTQGIVMKFVFEWLPYPIYP